MADKLRDTLEKRLRRKMYTMVKPKRGVPWGWWAFCEPHVKEITKNVKGGHCPRLSKEKMRCDYVLCNAIATHEFYPNS